MRSPESTIDEALVAPEDWRELASRAADGLEILLLWSKSTDRVKLTVVDSRLGEEFELGVASRDALTAYHHPFAYAARRGVCFGDAVRASLDLQPQN